MTSEIRIAHLTDRGVVALEGPDAEKLLQGLVSSDVGKLASQEAIHTGLLSPQGKILFEFFIVKSGTGLLLEIARERAGELVKRLTLYKLRANVRIADVSDAFAVLVLWGPNAASSGETGDTVSFPDPRQSELGRRILAEHRFATDISAATNGMPVDPATYHAHRISLGIPEGGRDYAFGEAFPHEALFDQLNGVSFTKGCYVGQEIVSRMEHRGTARRRIVPVVAHEGDIREGAPVVAGDVEIGTVGSVSGRRALALIRLDRAEEFGAKGVPLTVEGIEVAVALPPWAHFKSASSHG